MPSVLEYCIDCGAPTGNIREDGEGHYCSDCNDIILKLGYNNHYIGCHKSHIDCANKAIDEAIEVIQWMYSASFEVPMLQLSKADKWLDRWKLKDE